MNPSDTVPDINSVEPPNVTYRRVRKIYLACIGVALPLFFLSLVTSVNKIGYGILPGVLLVLGVGLLILAMIARGAARCPRCSNSLMWKSGPMGMGRLSLGVKPHCPTCHLDLNQIWFPPKQQTTEA